MSRLAVEGMPLIAVCQQCGGRASISFRAVRILQVNGELLAGRSERESGTLPVGAEALTEVDGSTGIVEGRHEESAVEFEVVGDQDPSVQEAR